MSAAPPTVQGIVKPVSLRSAGDAVVPDRATGMEDFGLRSLFPALVAACRQLQGSGV
jgi:hypothetical protein